MRPECACGRGTVLSASKLYRMESQGYAMNADGERVIAASKRPDGTLRKERRVRAGYVPQDEQPVYQPRGAVVRRPAEHCYCLVPCLSLPLQCGSLVKWICKPASGCSSGTEERP